MSRARVLLLALAGLALPVVLALGVYAASAQSLDAAPTIIQAPPTIAQGAVTGTEPATTTEPTQTETRPTTTSDDDDLPGKCDDPKHQLDPDCDPRTADDDSSGRGSGGSGSDDSSGPGSGGSDDSSGHGSGDDD